MEVTKSAKSVTIQLPTPGHDRVRIRLQTRNSILIANKRNKDCAITNNNRTPSGKSSNNRNSITEHRLKVNEFWWSPDVIGLC